jgi:hypothetical protein
MQMYLTLIQLVNKTLKTLYSSAKPASRRDITSRAPCLLVELVQSSFTSVFSVRGKGFL